MAYAEDEPDSAELAAAYGFGISASHPFRDGNERAAFLAVVMFLGLNGLELFAEEEDVVHVIRGMAAGDLTEAAFSQWIRERSQPLQ